MGLCGINACRNTTAPPMLGRVRQEITSRKPEQRRDVTDLGEHRVRAHATFASLTSATTSGTHVGASGGASGSARPTTYARRSRKNTVRSNSMRNTAWPPAAPKRSASAPAIRDCARFGVDIAVRERIVVEHARADVAKIAVDDVDIARNRLGDVRGRLGVEREELDVGGDAAGVEEAPRDGIEERFGELTIEQRLDQRFVCVARRGPQRSRTDALVEQELEPRERLGQAFVVEIHAPDDIDLRLLPVAPLEPAFGSTRDVGESVRCSRGTRRGSATAARAGMVAVL